MTRYSKTMTESYQEVVEKLKPSDGAGAYVKDFKKSDAPQFKGKSDDKLRDMAIAAYLDDKEENMQIEKMMDAYAVRYELQGKGRLVQAYKTKPDAEKRAKILKSMGGVKDVSITGPHNLNMKEDMSRYYDDTMLGLGKPKVWNPKNKKFEDYEVTIKEDYEVSMAVGQLRTVQEYATKITNVLNSKGSDYDIEAWVQSKITKAEDYLNSVGHYLENNPEVEKEEVMKNDHDLSEAKFEVKIKGLDTMFIDASSAGTVKANLKKMLRNPKDIESVERIAPTDMKKALRKKIAGKEDDGISKAPHIQAQEELNKTAYEKYTGVKNPVAEGRRSNYASDDEDEEGANKNIIMQLRKSLNLRNMYDVVFDDGKKVKVKEPVARAAIEMHSRFRLSRDKLAFQNKIGKSYRDLLNALKKG